MCVQVIVVLLQLGHDIDYLLHTTSHSVRRWIFWGYIVNICNCSCITIWTWYVCSWLMVKMHCKSFSKKMGIWVILSFWTLSTLFCILVLQNGLNWQLFMVNTHCNMILQQLQFFCSSFMICLCKYFNEPRLSIKIPLLFYNNIISLLNVSHVKYKLPLLERIILFSVHISIHYLTNKLFIYNVSCVLFNFGF